MSALVGSEKSISPPQGQSSLPGHRTRTGWYFRSRLALVLMRASHRPYVVSAPDHRRHAARAAVGVAVDDPCRREGADGDRGSTSSGEATDAAAPPSNHRG